MKVFLSHASDDKPIAETIALSIRSRGHDVFFDVDDLPAGVSYESRIEVAIEQCNVFLFLVSPHSVARGRFTLTEIGLARRRWPNPSGHVLPVMISDTAFESIPSYLRAVTVFRPEGNTAAETAAQVDTLQPKRQPKLWGRLPSRYWFALLGTVVVAVGAMGAWLLVWQPKEVVLTGSVDKATVGVGSDIQRIQKALGLPADGFFGPATQSAISEFLKGANEDNAGQQVSLRALSGDMPEMFKSPFERGYLGDPDKHFSVPSPARVEKAISILDPTAKPPTEPAVDLTQRLAVMRSAISKLRRARGLNGDFLDSSLIEAASTPPETIERWPTSKPGPTEGWCIQQDSQKDDLPKGKYLVRCFQSKTLCAKHYDKTYRKSPCTHVDLKGADWDPAAGGADGSWYAFSNKVWPGPFPQPE
jgi:hypothetical protein